MATETIVRDGQTTAGSVVIRSRGVTGLVNEVPRIGREPSSTRGDVREYITPEQPAEGRRALLEALRSQEMTLAAVIELDQLSSGRDGLLELVVDAPAEGEAQLMLESDATGVLRWHLPEVSGAEGVRSLGTETFRVPVNIVPVDEPQAPGGRTRGALARAVK